MHFLYFKAYGLAINTLCIYHKISSFMSMVFEKDSSYCERDFHFQVRASILKNSTWILENTITLVLYSVLGYIFKDQRRWTMYNQLSMYSSYYKNRRKMKSFVIFLSMCNLIIHFEHASISTVILWGQIVFQTRKYVLFYF